MCMFLINTPNGIAPCGKCPQCRVKRTDNWVFRISVESRKATSISFITLTYDQYSVNMTPNGFMTLNRTDWQLFMKRYRKACIKYFKKKFPDLRSEDIPKIKYYMCGEYGERRRRPHYHAIILNGVPDLIRDCWTYPKGHEFAGYPIGDVDIGDAVTNGAIAYTTAYMYKKSKVPLHRRDDRMKEFSLMSKKMGLSYLTSSVIKYHLSSYDHLFVTLPNGKKIALPRYFMDKILLTIPEGQERNAYKALRKILMEESLSEQYDREHRDFISRTGNSDHQAFFIAQQEARKAATSAFFNRSLIRD